MRIFNVLQGQLPVSWIGRTRCTISLKLKLIWQAVTPVESHMLTDRRTNGRTDDMCHTTIRPSFVGRIKYVMSNCANKPWDKQTNEWRWQQYPPVVTGKCALKNHSIETVDVLQDQISKMWLRIINLLCNYWFNSHFPVNWWFAHVVHNYWNYRFDQSYMYFSWGWCKGNFVLQKFPQTSI